MFSPAGYQALREGAGLLERNDRGCLRLTGADRRSLLQGLLTNDIVALGPGTGCYAALLTANGRMVADMRVLELGDALLLDLARPLAPAILERLDHSVFSEDVQLRDVSDEGVLLGIYGPASATLLGRAAGDPGLTNALAGLPEHASRVVAIGGTEALVVRSAEIGVGGFDILVPAGEADTVRARLLGGGAVAIDDDTAEVTRIEAGRPRFLVDMNEDTIPLEAGIESRAISLTKGCYVGQEIIIRVLHRGGGRVARRLVGLTLEAGSAVPAAGDPVRAGERQVGAVTSAAASPALGRPIVLAYVQRDFTGPGTALTVGEVPATVQALPFVEAPAPSAA